MLCKKKAWMDRFWPFHCAFIMPSLLLMRFFYTVHSSLNWSPPLMKMNLDRIMDKRLAFTLWWISGWLHILSGLQYIHDLYVSISCNMMWHHEMQHSSNLYHGWGCSIGCFSHRCLSYQRRHVFLCVFKKSNLPSGGKKGFIYPSHEQKSKLSSKKEMGYLDATP